MNDLTNQQKIDMMKQDGCTFTHYKNEENNLIVLELHFEHKNSYNVRREYLKAGAPLDVITEIAFAIWQYTKSDFAKAWADSVIESLKNSERKDTLQ